MNSFILIKIYDITILFPTVDLLYPSFFVRFFIFVFSNYSFSFLSFFCKFSFFKKIFHYFLNNQSKKKKKKNKKSYIKNKEKHCLPLEKVFCFPLIWLFLVKILSFILWTMRIELIENKCCRFLRTYRILISRFLWNVFHKVSSWN